VVTAAVWPRLLCRAYRNVFLESSLREDWNRHQNSGMRRFHEFHTFTCNAVCTFPDPNNDTLK
jgi:hypothetical protein